MTYGAFNPAAPGIKSPIAAADKMCKKCGKKKCACKKGKPC